MVHILGFNTFAYQLYQDKYLKTMEYDHVVKEKTLDNGKKQFGLKTERLMDLARLYYKCNTIEYVQLEDSIEGVKDVPSSYWERSLLGDELMTASTLFQPRLSLFTLTLLHDTGWYRPYYDIADDMLFGLCLLYTSPSPRDLSTSRMPSSA